MDLEETNNRFNSELQMQIEGTLPQGHIYSLGYPSEILREAGIPDLPIEVAAIVIAKKSDPRYKNSHPFELLEIKDLPNAIQYPVMVFDSKTIKGSKVVLTELQSKGTYFIVAIETNRKQSEKTNVIEINSIRSIYPKNRLLEIISNWQNSGLLRYANKKKASALVSQLQSNSADVATNTDASTHNIVKNFKNVK